MKIYSFFARRKAKRERFNYDLTRVLVSLKFRPRNWRCHFPFVLENDSEDMRVWMSNQHYGLDFHIDGREHGKMNIWGHFVPWRVKLFKAGLEAIANPWVEKYGMQWETMKHFPEWIKAFRT